MGLRIAVYRAAKKVRNSFKEKRKRKNFFLAEVEKLNAVPSATCDLSSLISLNQVPLREIFESRKIESEWQDARPEVEQFQVPDGTGGVNPGDRRAIFYLARYFQSRTVLEVGTHIGASTIHFAAALNRFEGNSNGNVRLISVDIRDVNDSQTQPWLAHGGTHSPKEMIRQLGFDSFVEFLANPSLEYLRHCNRKFDFIFLDGDHAAETVYKEFPAALKLLEKDGVILLHDYHPNAKSLWPPRTPIPGPFLAMERFKKEGVPVEVIPLGELPWPTKLNTNLTSLALVVKI